MTPKDLAVGLMRDVVDANLNTYRELFTKMLPNDASDSYWQNALTLFSSLSEQERDAFFDVVRQVSVDTVSNVLGILDGVNVIGGRDNEFKLLDGSDKKLNGDLQSLFLIEDEQIRSDK